MEINAKNQDGVASIHIAAADGHLDLIRVLVRGAV